MTFSVVARDADGSAFGVGVASKFLAVGAAVPAAQAGVGALATQSLANLAYRPEGLRLLASGVAPVDVVRRLVEPDSQRADRQLGVVGAAGPGAAHTGSSCEPWAGHAVGDGVAVQGNCLAGPEVVAAALAAYQAADGPLARRLLAALQAGDDAGGDTRGRQSAALLVVTPAGGYGGGSDVLVDLRVDDSPAPLPELSRLLGLHELYFGRPESLLPLVGDLAAEVSELIGSAGAPSLRRWMERENYEERWADGAIDPVVLARLRAAAGQQA